MEIKLLFMVLLGLGLTYDGIRRLRLRHRGKNQQVFRNICQAAVGMTVLVLAAMQIAKL
jgi:hypothetical protein